MPSPPLLSLKALKENNAKKIHRKYNIFCMSRRKSFVHSFIHSFHSLKTNPLNNKHHPKINERKLYKILMALLLLFYINNIFCCSCYDGIMTSWLLHDLFTILFSQQCQAFLKIDWDFLKATKHIIIINCNFCNKVMNK